MPWEPWTGCYKTSDGCSYCYYYGPYSKRCGQNTITKTENFYAPIEKKPNGKMKIASGANVPTCFATDFFLPEADEWRREAWSMIKQRPDVHFLFFTKRIDRFHVSLPEDWGEGYDNVTVGCTCENQETSDYRLPLYLSYSIKHRILSCTPLLSDINLRPYLHGIEHVTAGGETSRDARPCNFDWILNIREQCREAGITFWFKNTGSRFVKDGILQKVNPRLQHSMARETGINITNDNEQMTLE